MSGSSTKCINCQRSGHTIEKCWKMGEEVLTRLPIGGKLQKKRRMVKKGKRKSELMQQSLTLPLMPVVWTPAASFTARECIVQCGSKAIAQGLRHSKGFYALMDHPSVDHIHITCAAPGLNTWHQHLGHVNYSSIIQMAKKQCAKGMPASLDFLPQVCEHFVLAKQTQTSILKMQEGGRVKRLLEKMFLDIAGPQDVQTLAGGLYTLNFIDDFSQKIWVYILK